MEAANNEIQLPISTDLPVYFCDSIMCRLCGCTGNNVSFILLTESSYLAKKIHYEAGVKIKDTDILPKTVCGGCAEKVDVIRHFKRHCKKTQRVLLEMYEERCNRAELQGKEAPVVENNEVVVVDDDNEEKVVVEFVNNPLENTSVQNITDVISSNNNYNLLNNINTVDNVYSTVPTAIIYYNKVLGQMTKPRVQTYSKEELQQLSTQQTNEEENEEEINDDDEFELQNDDPESLMEGELELTDMIVKTETEITVENAPQKTKESEEQMQLDTSKDKFYGKTVESTNNSPLLYTLLTNKVPEPDFILPHQNFETFEVQNIDVTETTEETNQSTVDDDIEIIENKLDDESKLDTFIITKVVSTPETVAETENESNIRIDRSGRTFSSNSRTYVQKITDKEYACTICNEKFRYPFQADIHVRRHIGELPFKCKKCEKCFIKGYNLLKHERTHSTGQYICEICGKSFHDSYAIKDHQRIHNDPKPEFKCSICEKEFFTKANFESHKLIHAEKKHICEICGKIFPLYSVMRRHLARHKEDTIFKCNLCPKISKTKDQHMQHTKKHDEQGNFHCKACSLPFWTLKGLHVHETVTHNGGVAESTNNESPGEIQNDQEDK